MNSLLEDKRFDSEVDNNFQKNYTSKKKIELAKEVARLETKVLNLTERSEPARIRAMIKGGYLVKPLTKGQLIDRLVDLQQRLQEQLAQIRLGY